MLASAYAARGMYLTIGLRYRDAAAASMQSQEFVDVKEPYGGGVGALFALNESGKPAAAHKHGLAKLAMLRKTEASHGYHHYIFMNLREVAACSCLQLGRTDEAIRMIDEAIQNSRQTDPKDHVSQCWRGR